MQNPLSAVPGMDRKKRCKPRKFRVNRSDVEWAASLSRAEFSVMRRAERGTPWKGKYYNEFPITGKFACKGCGAFLYAASNKFDDGTGFCAFDECFSQNLYCAGLELDSGTKVWRAACTGCGCHIARVTRGEMRTTRNERHSVNSLSLCFIGNDSLVGSRHPPVGPLQFDEGDPSIFGAPSTSQISANTSAKVSSVGIHTRQQTVSQAEPSNTSQRNKRSDDEKFRACKHLLSLLSTLKRFQSTARHVHDQGHKTAFGNGDAAGSVNLPCSTVDKPNEDLASSSTPFFFGCSKCVTRHTPMHRCTRIDSWLCLSPGCNATFCKRYMIEHHRQAKDHCIVLTAGMSIWCFTCKRHLRDDRVNRLLRQAHLDRFGTLPSASQVSSQIRNGSALLRQVLGYQNAQSCACSICNSKRNPQSHLPVAVEVPTHPDPPHPSYIHMKGARGVAPSRSTLELIDRVKGMILGAALGDALGQITTGLSPEVASVVFRKLVISKRLNFQHEKMRPSPRALKRKGHKIGSWTSCTDLLIVSLQSLVAFGGRLECSDACFRLARYISAGVEVAEPYQESESEGFISHGVVTNYLSRVIGDDIERYALSYAEAALEAEHAYRKSNKEATCSNEAIFRTLIYSTCKFQDHGNVIRNTRKACRMTHSSARSIGACVAVNSSICMMLNGKYSWSSGGDQVCKLMQRDAFFVTCEDEAMNNFQDEFRSALLKGNIGPVGGQEWGEGQDWLEPSDDDSDSDISENALDLRGHVDNSGVAESDGTKLKKLNLGHVRSGSDILKSAAVAFWAQRYPKAEYMDAVMEIILQGGDASANACVAGAIMGLRVGYSKLPTHWLAKLRGRDWLIGLAEEYTNLFWM